MSELSTPRWVSLKEQELLLKPDITIDKTLRVKLLDRCGMTCTFCHNEGTPVAKQVGFQALRVSIYADRSQMPFTQEDIKDADADSFVDLLDDKG